MNRINAIIAGVAPREWRTIEIKSKSFRIKYTFRKYWLLSDREIWFPAIRDAIRKGYR